ncbi:MAG: VOC family protein [Pseudonocardiaceae bacterium]
MATGTIPKEFPGVTPHIVVKDAQAAIDFTAELFGAEVLGRQKDADGHWWYCELLINNGRFMVSHELPEMGFFSPLAVGGTPVQLHIYVTDVDAVFEKALAAGAKPVTALQDHYWGDRSGRIEDPFGHIWTLSTRLKKIPNDELYRLGDEEVARRQSQNV